MRNLTRNDSNQVLYLGTPLPDGPWNQEPDHEDFVSPEGFPCIIHRNNLGAWCGYVAVPTGHPWHGKGYSDVDADVHGGLTYAESCNGPICHMPKPGDPDDVWWLGFDCIHSGDVSLFDVATGRRTADAWGGTYKTAGYVKAETLALAKQAADAAGN